MGPKDRKCIKRACAGNPAKGDEDGNDVGVDDGCELWVGSALPPGYRQRFEADEMSVRASLAVGEVFLIEGFDHDAFARALLGRLDSVLKDAVGDAGHST